MRGASHPRDRTSEQRIFRLDISIRSYAWGSVTAIPELLGHEPSGEPAAELWIGAHPDKPSRWREHPDRPGLDELIAADPVGMLGPETSARFGGRLPFLLKLLAAEKALSIQVHPTIEQARRGFADEEARGVPRDAPERNYRDDNHKPELLCALTDLEAFSGFRPITPTVELLGELIDAGAGLLQRYRAMLTGSDGVRTIFSSLLTLTETERAALVAQVRQAAARVSAGGGEWADAAAASVMAGSDFPGDVGAVLTLLLNHVRLRPGESIFLGAGTVHAYLRGFGVEILANSDNVLRCGLTPKHIDVAELLHVADFRPLPQPRSPVSVISESVTIYPVPVADFLLMRIEPARAVVDLAAGQPHLLLTTAGTVHVDDGSGSREVTQGDAVFIAASAVPVQVGGPGIAFVATVNAAAG